MKDDITQEALNLAGAWVLGEFGESLFQPNNRIEELQGGVRESDVVDLFSNILASGQSGQVITEYIINAAIKLTTRLHEAAQIERLRRLLETYQTDINVEIQQRAIEYGGLFSYDQVRKGVVEKMPPPEIREEQRVLGEAPPSKRKVTKTQVKKQAVPATEQDMLLDLMGDSVPSNMNSDVLGGQASNNLSSIIDLIGSSSTTQLDSSADVAHNAFNEDDLSISFQVNRKADAVQLQAKFKNNSMFESFKDVKLQAAVPKSQKLQLHPISNSDLSEGQEATQIMRITSVQGVSIINSA